VESSLQPHSIIAKKSSLVRERKSYVEKSGEIPIKGTGPAAQQEIRIAATSLDQ